MSRRIYALWAKDPSIFYDINVTGTRTLLEAARLARNSSARFIAAPSARSGCLPTADWARRRPRCR